MGTKHTKPCKYNNFSSTSLHVQTLHIQVRICSYTFRVNNKILGPMFHERFPFCGHAYEIPVLRALTFMTIAGLIVNILMTVVFFYMHWNFRLLIKNSFMLIIACFTMIMVLEALITSEIHFEVNVLREKMFPLSEAGPETLQRIKKDISFLRYSRIFVVVFLFISAMFCTPISGDIREFFCIVYLVEDIENAFWYPYLKYILFVLKIIFVLSFSNPLYMMLCVIGDNFYGLMILREKVNSIEQIFGRKEIWYRDQAYQKYVRMTLIRCIQQHRIILA
ncbi:uncharacterized protein LOC123318208 [Coccinella septempunctata]|uniref:uncharacterized protein LOC123318208 n=1 Tax=Coccinella septempunctata TaxID=41139 RepID=UPI001D087512|nr:uncharacterized protein LOC123318208 [Coccinella septempunctata]